MRLARLRAITFCVLTFAGVASARAGWEEDRGKAEACYNALAQDADLQVFESKLVFSAPTVAQLSDENIPSEAEARAIGNFAEKVRSCRGLMLAAYQAHFPPLATAWQIRSFQADLIYVELLKRRIAYGNANRLFQEAYLAFVERVERYHQAKSDEERRALAASLDSLSKQFQSSPPPTLGPRRVTCRWVGPTLYCDAI